MPKTANNLNCNLIQYNIPVLKYSQSFYAAPRLYCNLIIAAFHINLIQKMLVLLYIFPFAAAYIRRDFICTHDGTAPLPQSAAGFAIQHPPRIIYKL